MNTSTMVLFGFLACVVAGLVLSLRRAARKEAEWRAADRGSGGGPRKIPQDDLSAENFLRGYLGIDNVVLSITEEESPANNLGILLGYKENPREVKVVEDPLDPRIFTAAEFLQRYLNICPWEWSLTDDGVITLIYPGEALEKDPAKWRENFRQLELAIQG